MVVLKNFFFAESTWTYPIQKPTNIALYLNSREALPSSMAQRPRPASRQRQPSLPGAFNKDQDRGFIERQPDEVLARPDVAEDFISTKLPGSFSDQREFDTTGLDKFFAAAWLDEQSVVVGTKCNKLLVMNVENGRKVDIPLVANAVPGWARAGVGEEDDSSIKWQDGKERAGSRSALSSVQREQMAYEQANGTGIRSIAINPLRTLIAVGVGKPLGSVEIFSLPTFEPVAVLGGQKGHEDIVFAISWLTDSLLVTASRDKTVKIWSVTSEGATEHLVPLAGPDISIFEPCHSVCQHKGKVRDMKYEPQSMQLATLGTEGYVKLWDARRVQVKSDVPLRFTDETCCLALDERTSIYAVGSSRNISLIDPRLAKVVYSFESCDDGWGVRSLAFNKSALAVGGGKGRISFWDLRSSSYISWNRPESSGIGEDGSSPSPPTPMLTPRPASAPVQSRIPSSPIHHMRPRRYSSAMLAGLPSMMTAWMTTGDGYVDRNEYFQNNLRGAELRHAVYTLAWSDCGEGKLFAAGGPLSVYARGSWAGVF